MSSLDVVSSSGESAGRTVQLPDDIFAVKVNVPLIHQVVVAQQAAARQGTHATKGRGAVRGGGKKPYRQKGTGRARQGSIRAPQFTGGGTVHGPQPRSYAQRTPKKMKAAALRGALSDRARNGRVHVITEFIGEDVQAKLTQTAQTALRTVTERKHVLVVLDREDERSWLGLRNVQGVHLLAADQLNTLDVMLADDVVFTEKGYAAFLAHAAGVGQSSGEEDK